MMRCSQSTVRPARADGLFRVPITLLLSLSLYATATGTDQDIHRPLSAKDSAFVRNTVNTTLCPCGCGNYLPGSINKPVCFGCSVGKAEIARMEEGLATGHSRGEMLMQIRESIIIDVFADYSDPAKDDLGPCNESRCRNGPASRSSSDSRTHRDRPPGCGRC